MFMEYLELNELLINALINVLILSSVFALSLFLTYATRFCALRLNLLDVPNQRSSHTCPTPRGGGIAIVLTFTLALTFLWSTNYLQIETNLLLALLGGIPIACLGFCDDIFQMKARVRIVIHLLAALWSLFWLGGLPTLDFGTWQFHLTWLGSLIAIICIIWVTNLYNFMDGIDGLAGCEALFVTIASAFTLFTLHNSTLTLILCVFAASIGGFVFWNWPPAKIFLGDVGSGFLGFTFAIIGIYSVKETSLSLSFWLTLLAIFVCDATFTVIYRGMKGKPWYNAHRDHAYQRLIIRGLTHKQVLFGVNFVNVFLLLPIALATIHLRPYAFWLMISAVFGLYILWLFILRKSINLTRTSVA